MLALAWMQKIGNLLLLTAKNGQHVIASFNSKTANPKKNNELTSYLHSTSMNASFIRNNNMKKLPNHCFSQNQIKSVYE